MFLFNSTDEKIKIKHELNLQSILGKSCLTYSFKTIIPILGLDNDNVYIHFPFRDFVYVDFSVQSI